MRHLADDGYRGEVLNITTATNGHIQEVAHIEESEWQQEANKKCHQHNDLLARRDWRITTEGSLNNADVSLGDGQLQSGFLAFVEQVGIKRFLNVLLTRDVDNLFLFLWYGSDIRTQAGLFLLGTPQLKIKGAKVCARRSNDGRAHLLQCILQLTYLDAGLTGTLHEAVVLKHRVVVLGYLRLDAGIRQASQRRNQMEASGIVA